MKIVKTDCSTNLQPLTCSRTILECQVAGEPLGELLQKRFAKVASYLKLAVLDTFWPSENIISTLASSKTAIAVKSEDDTLLAWASQSGDAPAKETSTIALDTESIRIMYPWDILAINEQVVGKLKENKIDGIVRENVTIDGYVKIGEGTILLPGVYIEGNVIIGKNCKIGPNCHLRGNSSIGDGCHIGQAVEIKNSIIMNNVWAGHLSYIGDSIIGENANWGAGTITANFRHDGKNHHSYIDGELIDTGREKLGCIMGDNVHTGIHTSIYPGRKIWPYSTTLPGAVVKRDIKGIIK